MCRSLRKVLQKTGKARPIDPVPAVGRSAERSSNERSDASTGLVCGPGVLGLGEDADQGLCPGPADQDSALVAQLAVHGVDLREQARRKLPHGNTDVLLGLVEARHLARRLRERAAADRRAQQQCRGEAVSRDVVAQADDVARLLAAELAALPPKRLEDVPV